MSPTSEQSPTTTVYIAGLGRRLGALLYDSLLILAIWMATILIMVVASNQAVSGWWLQVLLLLEWIGFYIYAWHKSGQTVGMMAWRIKTLQPDGTTPTLQQCARRLVIAPFSFCFALLGYLWMFVNEEKATWHDKFSNTVVVHFPKENG